MGELEQFKYYLIREEQRAATVEKHLANLSLVLTQTKTLNVIVVQRYIYTLYERGRSEGHLNNIIAAFRLYGKFSQTDCYKSLKYFKIRETVKGTLSDDEIEKFLAIPPTAIKWIDKEVFILFTKFFAILAYSGMRPSELSTMRLQQVDFGTGVFRLDSTTKTSKPRTVPISPTIIPLLQRHIISLTTDNLFPPMDRHKWKEQFNMRIKFLGIKRDKITTYSLRHSWVTRLLDEDANPHVMAEIAGHSLEQQKNYYHLTTKSKQIVIRKDPLGRKQLTKTERILQGRKSLEDLGFTVFESQEIQDGKIRYVVIDE